jgi:hypothetical protein
MFRAIRSTDSKTEKRDTGTERQRHIEQHFSFMKNCNMLNTDDDSMGYSPEYHSRQGENMTKWPHGFFIRTSLEARREYVNIEDDCTGSSSELHSRQGESMLILKMTVRLLRQDITRGKERI